MRKFNPDSGNNVCRERNNVVFFLYKVIFSVLIENEFNQIFTADDRPNIQLGLPPMTHVINFIELHGNKGQFIYKSL